MAGVEIIEGDRRNSFIYVSENYCYITNSVRLNLRYLQCQHSLCNVRAVFNGQDISITSEGQHNHPPDVQHIDQLRFRRVLRNRSANVEDITRLTLHQIFEDESARNPQAAQYVTFEQMRSMMTRARNAVRPPIPGTLNNYGLTLGSAEWSALYGQCPNGGLFFRRHIVSGETESLVFCSQEMLQLLRTARKLFIDATFKITPSRPRARQLLTIHMKFLGYTLPVVYVLMSHKSRQAYDAVFDYIANDLCPELQPSNVMTDFEAGMRASLRQAFPNARHSGCKFHFDKAVFKKARTMGLQNFLKQNHDAWKVVAMVMALPLLPPASIEQGFQDIITFARDHNIYNRMRPWMNYITNQWMNRVGVEAISVHRLRDRTNNWVESFYSSLNRRSNNIAHPNAWNFARTLLLVDATTRRDVGKIRRALPVRRRRKSRYLTNDARIRTATASLENGDYNIMNFLNAVSHTVAQANLEVDLGISDIDDDGDNIDLVGMQNVAPAANQPVAGLPQNVPANPLADQIPPLPPGAIERPICVACRDATATLVVVYCGHLCLCPPCKNLVILHQGHLCPLCRGAAFSFTEVRGILPTPAPTHVQLPRCSTCDNDQVARHVVGPCGHMCVCNECRVAAEQGDYPFCPICQTDVQWYVRVEGLGLP